MVKKFAKRALQAGLDRLGYSMTLTKMRVASEPRTIHFLHIGKAAGSQVKGLAAQLNGRDGDVKILKHHHDVYLRELPKDCEYFFSIRNPITRFKSGFYSRKRKGQPKLYIDWTAHEAQAFADFEHANDLAEALFRDDATGDRAWMAMKAIQHTAQNQSDWFYLRGALFEVQPPIWIIRQEHFEDDLKEFMARADLGVDPSTLQIARDKVGAHANDYTDIPELSELAQENLRRWYAQDVAFYAACTRWLEAQRG
ncbi:hypothetical protein ACQ5SO_13880 [Rhodovulum sp. DZ06]|uniref:hypothetical protein n=1 Tax=Rhodovulum sp. DZ06 TaxID=3425126 RepID=UPI003D3418E7